VRGLHDDARRVLEGWTAPDSGQERLRRAYLDHLGEHADAMWRSCVPSHLTASLLVLDPGATQVLLSLHRKGNFWVQFGGHCEAGDRTLAEAALREGAEESGLTGLTVVGADPVDLDRHALSSAFGSCGEHLDVRYAAVAPSGADPVTSDESHAVAWFGIDALPDRTADGVASLTQRARSALLG